MGKFALAVIAALFAVPALAVAGSTPSSADAAAAVKQCSSLRTGMGLTPFKLSYGTNANKSNAFGKCVSQQAHLNALARGNAAKQCASARTANPAGFAAQYGEGAKHAHAFGNCVSSLTKAAEAAQVQATISAAKQCSTERKAGVATFNAKYGTGAAKSNAFGKCVSAKVKQSGQ